MLIVVSPAKKLDMTPREDLEQSQPIFPEQDHFRRTAFNVVAFYHMD